MKESEKLHKEYWKAWEKQTKKSQKEIRKLERIPKAVEKAKGINLRIIYHACSES